MAASEVFRTALSTAKEGLLEGAVAAAEMAAVSRVGSSGLLGKSIWPSVLLVTVLLTAPGPTRS